MRFKAKISFIRLKAAKAILDCKDPWSLVKDLHEPQLQQVHSVTQGIKSMEERMAFYGEQYLRQLSNALIGQLKDSGIEPKRKKVMTSYAKQEKRIIPKL